MRVRRALLDPADMQRGGPEVHLLPSQVYQFGRAKTVAVGHEDHRGVPVPPAALPGRIHQPPDLSVKYSRVRSLLFGGRFGRTVRFTMAGVTSLRCRLAMCFALPAG
jgi:hypothetical protein